MTKKQKAEKAKSLLARLAFKVGETVSPEPGVRHVARLVLSVLDAERKRVAEDQWPDYLEEEQ